MNKIISEQIMIKMPMGRLRVGRSTYTGKNVLIPEYDGFTNILVLTERYKSFYELCPYHLKNGQGQILENVYQFSKVYKEVPKAKIPYSSGDRRIVWDWPQQVHLDKNDNLTDDYWNWRINGKNNQLPVRNPVGWKYMKNCLFALEKDEPISETNPPLDYIEGRKKIYLPIYMEAVFRHQKFHELLSRLLNGENLMIIEVDGPHQESLQYYQQKYGVSDDFIESDSIEVTEKNLAIMINDTKHPFGHGYCLAWALLVAAQF